MRSDYLLLIFLRHLACIACRPHLEEVASQVDRLRTAGISVVAISQAKPEFLAMFLRQFPQPFPVVADPDRQAYRAFNLERARWRDFFHPGEIARYLGIMARGHRVQRPFAGEDLLQLGGDFLLDRHGKVRFAYRCQTATDWPRFEEILAAATAG